MAEHDESNLGAHAASVAFGQRLRRLRATRGLSQEEVAQRANLHTTVIGRFEHGAREPRLTTILRLALGLGVKPGELVEGLDATGGEA